MLCDFAFVDVGVAVAVGEEVEVVQAGGDGAGGTVAAGM